MAKSPTAPPANVLTIEEVTALVFRYWVEASNDQKAIAVAVSAAETGGTFDASASLVNTAAMGAKGESVGSIDRGLWQLNSWWHREVPDSEAYDPDRCAYHAHRIWKQDGNTFSKEWATAKGGDATYLQYMDEARDAVSLFAGGSPSLPATAPGDPTMDVSLAPPGSVLYGGHLYTPDVNYTDPQAVVSASEQMLITPEGRLVAIGLEQLISGVAVVERSLPGTPGYLVPKVVGTPEIDLAMSEGSQLTIVFDDEDLSLAASHRLFMGARIEYAGLRFIVEDIGVGGDKGPPQLTVKALSAAVHNMKDERGAKVVSNVSPTEYAFAAAKKYGLSFVGQTSYRRVQIARGEAKPGTQELGESEWEVLQRLAGEIGFVCFESYNVLFFVKPSYLAHDKPQLTKTHMVVYPSAAKYLSNRPDLAAMFLTPLSVPAINHTLNDKLKDVFTGTITLRWESGSKVRPGEKITLEGVTGFDGTYLIDHVPIPVDGHSQIEVSIVSPIDPEPSQKEEFSLGTDELPPGTEEDGGGNAAAQDFPTDGTLFWPAGGRIVGDFGEPRPNHPHGHEGLDIAPYTQGKKGVQTRSAAGGIVTRAEFSSSYGNVVYIDHGTTTLSDGSKVQVETRYAHHASLAVKKGQQVAQGQRLGIMGQTGHADGIHCHFEVRHNGTAVSPWNYLRDKDLPSKNGGMPTEDEQEWGLP